MLASAARDRRADARDLAAEPRRCATPRIVDIVWGLGLRAGRVGRVRGRRRLRGAPSCSSSRSPTLWGLRLGAYLAWRNCGNGEDYRYQAMRRRYGARFPLVSLVLVFGLQGVLMWIVSLPVQAAQVPASPPVLVALDVVGLALWCVGLVFETDRRPPARALQGRPREQRAASWTAGSGATRATRTTSATSACGGASTLIALRDRRRLVVGRRPARDDRPAACGSPAWRCSSAHMTKRRPGYAEYVARTSAFFPRPPRSAPRSARGG